MVLSSKAAYTKDGFSIEANVSKLLEDYTKEVKEQTDKAFEQTAKEAVQKLRQTSPRGNGKNAGAYAKSWTVKRERDKRTGLYTVTVHNKDHYQLTHLLEEGHDLPQGGRWEPSKQHIEPVEQWSQQEVVRKIEELLG